MKNRLISIPVLFEDEHYVVFDKPPGLLVIPTDKKEANTLDAIVNKVFAREKTGLVLHPCHRIDQDTSGAIIFAKGKQNQKRMMGVFKGRGIEKKYIAFVHGRMKYPQGEFRSKTASLEQRKFKKAGASKPALTRYRVIDVKRYFSVVEVRPVTGRTNQIRIHFAEAGHPLVGERKYAFAKDFELKFRRTALHAQHLEWTHPVTRKKITINCQLPKDMEALLENN